MKEKLEGCKQPISKCCFSPVVFDDGVVTNSGGWCSSCWEKLRGNYIESLSEYATEVKREMFTKEQIERLVRYQQLFVDKVTDDRIDRALCKKLTELSDLISQEK